METATVQKETLWRNHNFLKLWTSDTISQFGSQFTGLALPLTAFIILHSNPTEQGFLIFVGTIPWLLFGLFVGVWVDRHRKQRIMVTSNILRGSMLALIPIAAVLGWITRLGILFLYAISFFVGFLQVFFDVTYQSFLPSLVRREQLVEGNTKLQASASTAQVAGPNIALIEGLIFSVGSVGALVGVALATRIARGIGVGLSIIGSMIIGGLGAIPYYLSGSLTASPLFALFGLDVNWYLLTIMAGQFVSFVGVVVYNINQVSLRQAIVPIRLQGRMNATMRFLVWGTIPLGGLAGGLLATLFGVRSAVGIVVLGGCLAFLWVLLSPVRSLKEIPESME